jgi:hypothetical protein
MHGRQQAGRLSAASHLDDAWVLSQFECLVVARLLRRPRGPSESLTPAPLGESRRLVAVKASVLRARAFPLVAACLGVPRDASINFLLPGRPRASDDVWRNAVLRPRRLRK